MNVIVTTNDRGIFNVNFDNCYVLKTDFDPDKVTTHAMDWELFSQYITHYVVDNFQPGFILNANCSR